jgi:hypothetical protein
MICCALLMGTRAARRKTMVDLDQLEPALREALSRQRLFRATDLTRAGVPRAQHGDAIARLRAAGFEAVKSGVRVPLRRQLEFLLHEREILPLAQLGKALRGVTQKEAKSEAESLAREGRARIAIRGKIEVLVAEKVKTLSREQLATLADAGARSARAMRKSQRTLLAADVRDQLAGVVASPAQPLGAEILLSELARHVRPSVGLSFVPDTVRALESRGVATVHAALLEVARTGRIELQPESGLNRLSAAELALCPPGPQGTRLSWARLIERPTP